MSTSIPRSAGLYCFISAAAIAGSFAGWFLWSGGWQRQRHWGEGTLWALSAIIGLLAAGNAIRRAYARGSEGAMAIAFGTLLVLFHLLSLLLLSDFAAWSASGGLRP